MCMKCVKIKNSSQAGITWSYVPCGKCVDCRRKLAQAWSFRINSEFMNLKKRGWNVAFCTLTYRNEELPSIPAECFVSDYKYIPCFNRAQTREWIDEIRQYCKYHFGFVKDKDTGEDNRIRYFIATELGTLRHRPHMHAILAWPNSVSYEKMHSICSEKWTHGFLFPRRPEGDGKCLSFEVVGDASKCFTYISKYVCKDLELDKLQTGSTFYSKRKDYEEDSDEMCYYRLWRNCQSFHMQSQSLGFEAIKNLSDEEKMDIYRHGMYFSADKDAKPQQVPLYIKHKLIFDPFYVYDETGKRLVRRKANAFFLAHAHEIFDAKAEFYQQYCCSSESVGYYKNRGLNDSQSALIASKIQKLRSRVDEYCMDLVSDNKMGKMYLAYHRVNPMYCFDIELCNQWLLRYSPDASLKPSIRTDFWFWHLCDLQAYWTAVDYANSLLGSFGAPEREHDEERISEILDFFKNL